MESLNIWSLGQLPFWAAIHVALFFGLISAIYGVVHNKRMGFTKQSAIHWYFVLYIIAKAAAYAIYCIPLEIVLSQFTYQITAKVIAILSVSLLFGAVSELSRKTHGPNRAYIFFLSSIIIWTTCTWHLSTSLSCQLVASGELTLCLLGAIQLALQKDLPAVIDIHRIRSVSFLWIIFLVLDAINRLIPTTTVAEGMLRLLSYIAGIATLVFIIINLRGLPAFGRAQAKPENKYRLSLTIVGWACVGIVITLAMIVTDHLTRQYYQSEAEDTSRMAGLMLDRVRTWQEQDEILMRATGESPLILELLSHKGSHDSRGADIAIDRCAYGIKDSVCFIINSTGKCIASSNRYMNNNYTGKAFSNESFFKNVMQDSMCTQYKNNAIQDMPAAYTAYPIHDKDTYEVMGAVVLEKALSAEKLFIGYPHAFLLGSSPGSFIIQSADHNLLGLTELQLRSQNDVPLVGFGTNSKGTLTRLKGNIYFLGLASTAKEECCAGILRDATTFFVYRATADMLAALAVAITIALFAFLRYVAERTEYELTQAKEFKHILDCSPNCVALLDSTMNCYHLYGPFQFYMGISETNLVGKPFVDIWPVEQRIMIRDKIRDVLQGHSTSFECTYITPDGHIRYFYVYCGPLFNPSGNADRAITVLVDITQRKKIEQELLGRLDLERTLSTITQEFLSGNLAEESLQKSLWHLLQFCKQDRVSWFEFKSGDLKVARCLYKHDSGSLTAEQLMGFYPKVSFDGPMERHLLTLRDKKHVILNRATTPEAQAFLDSQYIRSCLLVPIFIEKHLNGFLRVDCSRNKEACRADEINRIKMIADLLQESLERAKDEQTRKLLDAAVQSAHDAIIIYNQMESPDDPRVEYINPAAIRMFGYAKEEIIGANPTIFYANSSKDRAADVMDILAQSKEFHGETVNVRKDGSEFMAEVSVSPIVDAKGNITHCISVRRDVTQQREMQQRSSLSSKLESIGQLAAGIAHEINSPAQFISDNLHFLKDAFQKLQAGIQLEKLPIPEEQKPALARITREIPEAISDGLEGVQRIASIVQAMREFSHTTAEKTRADLNKAIATTITVARNEWKYYADVATQFAPDLPMVLCHVGDINQVVLNLIVNSAHSIKERFGSGEKKGEIIIHTYAEGPNVKIEVEDNGNGIPDQIKEKVYDPFFTTKPQGQGTGQGLYLSHRIIVDKHKGSIGFTSTVGVGTKFTITLPIG